VQYTFTKYFFCILLIFKLSAYSQQSDAPEIDETVKDSVSDTSSIVVKEENIRLNPLLMKEESDKQRFWVDSIYNKMSLKEKIGQLFMVDVFSSKSKTETDKIKKLIEEFHIGGIIFSKVSSTF